MTLGFPAVWLRRNCPCPGCRDPVTGQRLLAITDIPNGLVASVTAQTADAVEVTFAPGGHRSVFSRAWLAAHAGEEADPRTEDAKRLWRAADMTELPAADWTEYLRASGRRRAARRGPRVIRRAYAGS